MNGMRPIHPDEILREEFLVPLRLSAMPWPSSSRFRPRVSTTSCANAGRHAGYCAQAPNFGWTCKPPMIRKPPSGMWVTGSKQASLRGRRRLGSRLDSPTRIIAPGVREEPLRAVVNPNVVPSRLLLQKSLAPFTPLQFKIYHCLLLATGDWRLATGDWQLEAGSR